MAAPNMGARIERKRQKPKPSDDVARLKVLVLGDAGTGKTALVKRFVDGPKAKLDTYCPTVGVDFFVKPATFQGREIRLNVWDVSGSPEFFDVRSEFYKETHACLLVYDVTSRQTYEALDAVWLREAARCGGGELIFVVVGTKIDQERNRAIATRQAKEWAGAEGFKYFEVSATSGDGVDDLWMEVAKLLV